jgi:hypothetical protein
LNHFDERNAAQTLLDMDEDCGLAVPDILDVIDRAPADLQPKLRQHYAKIIRPYLEAEKLKAQKQNPPALLDESSLAPGAAGLSGSKKDH